MRSSRVFATLIALLILTAAPAAPAPAPATGGPEVVAVQDSLRLQAHTTQPAYDPGEVVLINATATNTGNSSLEYWLPTPCDSPFRVTLATPTGDSAPLPRASELGRGPLYCAQVVTPFQIAPGQSVSEQFAWDTAAAKATAGDYSMTVAFTAKSWTDAPTASLTLPVTIGRTLTDVAGHWAAANIADGVKAGFVNGYPDRTFRPNNQVTRAELIKMLAVARGLTPRSVATPTFADAATHWVESQGYLEAVIEASILHPADYGPALVPDAPATRRETAMMVVRALGLDHQATGVTPDALPFSDRTAIPDWAAGPILTASSTGIITGYDDKSFRPNNPVTRAEAVTMLLRMQKAGAVQVDSTAALKVDGQPAATGIAFLIAYARHLAPLAPLAAATGMEVTKGSDGWYTLSRGARTLAVKPAVPYGLTGDGQKVPLDVALPVVAGDALYVPEAALPALGLSGHWDDTAKAFLVVTQ